MNIEALPGQPNRIFTAPRPEWEILNETFAAHDRFVVANPGVKIDALLPVSFNLQAGGAIVGSYTRKVAYEIAAKRADLVRTSEAKKPEKDRTGMAVVLGDGSFVESLARKLGLEWTNDNLLAHVLGGRMEDLSQLKVEAGAKFKGLLSAEGIYHSQSRSKESEQLAEILEGYDFVNPTIPIISSTNPRELTTGSDIKQEMYEQMLRKVKLSDIIAFIKSLREGEHTLFDVSADNTFQKLLRRVQGLRVMPLDPNQAFA